MQVSGWKAFSHRGLLTLYLPISPQTFGPFFPLLLEIPFPRCLSPLNLYPAFKGWLSLCGPLPILAARSACSFLIVPTVPWSQLQHSPHMQPGVTVSWELPVLFSPLYRGINQSFAGWDECGEAPPERMEDIKLQEGSACSHPRRSKCRSQGGDQIWLCGLKLEPETPYLSGPCAYKDSWFQKTSSNQLKLKPGIYYDS